VFICVDGVFICLFFHFCILVIFINLSNKLVIINLRSKEINLHNKIFQNIVRSVVTNCLEYPPCFSLGLFSLIHLVHATFPKAHSQALYWYLHDG
jgi:hypothetical protein